MKNTAQQVAKNTLPETRLVRLSQILGDKKKGIPPILPVSRSHFLACVKAGQYPQPVRLSPKIVCWRFEEILELIRKAV